MTGHVRVGIVGTSWWADMMYLPSLQSHSQAEIVAICGRDRDRATEIASKYSIPQVFTDYHELIGKGDVQALVVATPDDVHYPVTMAALDAGLHVLCEKPMALNTQQAREMAEKAASVGIKNMILFTNRWMPHVRYLHQLVEEGYLGRCFHCHFQHFGGYGREGNYQWKWDRQHGLGILGDLGAHMIDLALWCVGDISKVSANLKAFVKRPGPEGQSFEPSNDAAMLQLQFANGSQGSIHVSAVAHMADRFMEQRFVLYGEDGTLEVASPLNGKYVIQGARHDEDQLKPLTIPESILQGVGLKTSPMDHMGQVFTKQSAGSRTFIDAILNDQPVTPNFTDGMKVQEVIDAAFTADEQGRWISIES